MALTPIRLGTQLTLMAGIAWLTAGPSAQGLGEVAKKEVARRQQVATGKKYTNEDLQAVTPATPVQPLAPAPAAAPTAEADDKDSKDAPADGAAAEQPAGPQAREKRDEKYWRERSGLLRAKLDERLTKVKAIQQRLEQLDEALASGAGSSHSQERAVTLKALGEAQADYNYLREEWKRMENRAHTAKVPEEWIK